MFAKKKDLLLEKYSTDLDYFNQDFSQSKNLNYDYADSIFNFIQQIIDDEEASLSEDFISDKCKEVHFNKHCKRNLERKRSKKHTVYYDFNTIEDYTERESKISKAIEKNIQNKELIIEELADVTKVEDSFNKILTNGGVLTFSGACGFNNNIGIVRVSINAYADEATTNYSGNTVDFVVQTLEGKTISLYPVDAGSIKQYIAKKISKNN